MTCTATSSPTFSAAAAPASTAAFTEATSPENRTVTSAGSVRSVPRSLTGAALTPASAASMAPTSPLVSIRPRACSVQDDIVPLALRALREELLELRVRPRDHVDRDQLT